MKNDSGFYVYEMDYQKIIESSREWLGIFDEREKCKRRFDDRKETGLFYFVDKRYV